MPFYSGRPVSLILGKGVRRKRPSETYLSSFDANIGQTKCRASPKMNASVAVSVDGRCHGDLHVLQLCSLCHAPPERREGVACEIPRKSESGREPSTTYMGLSGISGVVLPPGMLVVSSTRFFSPTAKDSSPLIPVPGSCPISTCQMMSALVGHG
jgi:hypothetical protein